MSIDRGKDKEDMAPEYWSGVPLPSQKKIWYRYIMEYYPAIRGNEILDMPIQIIIILTATHKTTHIHKYKKKNNKYSTSLVIKDMQN